MTSSRRYLSAASGSAVCIPVEGKATPTATATVQSYLSLCTNMTEVEWPNWIARGARNAVASRRPRVENIDGRSIACGCTRVNHSPFLPQSCGKGERTHARVFPHPLPPSLARSTCNVPLQTCPPRDNPALIRFVLKLTPTDVRPSDGDVDCTMARFIKKGHERKGLHSDPTEGGMEGASFEGPSRALVRASPSPLDIDI